MNKIHFFEPLHRTLRRERLHWKKTLWRHNEPLTAAENSEYSQLNRQVMANYRANKKLNEGKK